MRLFVTTSRKPSALTRRLAKWLSVLLQADNDNRGKKSIQDVVAEAEKKGCGRVMLIYESHGNPAKLAFLDATGWMEEVAIARVIDAPARIPRGLPKAVAADTEGSDADGGKLLELLGLKAGKSNCIMAHARQGALSFTLSGKPIGPAVRFRGEVN